MTSSQFPIPQGFKAELRYVDAKDHRTDAEILAALAQPPPITSEKNIWTYWHAGVSKIPSWCQRNICSWVRLHGSEWNVRVLDTVPGSPNHALKWISPEDLPECFVKGTMTGPYTGPHSADFLRGAVLYAYGGVWMDVGCIVFRHMDKICWDQLADENSPYTVSAPNMFAQYMANHMVAARKGDIFVKKWHELFLHFWEGKSDHSEIVQSPLIGFVRDFDFSQSEQKGFHWEFKVDPLFVLGYVGQVIAWMRVAFLKEPNGGFDGVEYYANKILLFDSLTEDWAAETVVGFKGEDLFKVFTTRLDADPNSEEYKKAHDCAWRLLTKSCMQKITHGKGLTHDMHCGALLDLPENKGKDCQPGTFGALLRYGSVHFEQTRETINYAESERPDPKMIIHKRLTEA